MASQLASNVRCHPLMHCAAFYGERGSLCHRQNYGYHQIQPQEHDHNNMHGTKRGRKQAQKLHRLGFSYLASSFLYLVIKAKAFYNGFLGDVASEPKVGIEAPISTTEAYFSVPVLPY